MTAIWNVLHTSMRYEIHALYLLIIIMHACLIPIYMIMQYCQLEVYAIFLRMTAVLEMECITFSIRYEMYAFYLLIFCMLPIKCIFIYDYAIQPTGIYVIL